MEHQHTDLPLSKDQYRRAQAIESVAQAWDVFLEVQSDEIRSARPEVMDKMKDIFFAGASAYHHLMSRLANLPDPDADDMFKALDQEMIDYSQHLKSRLPEDVQKALREWEAEGRG